MPSGLSGVKTIYSTTETFAALKEDGTVEAWVIRYGGDGVPSGLSGVKTIYSTDSAFAALKEDGTVAMRCFRLWWRWCAIGSERREDHQFCRCLLP